MTAIFTAVEKLRWNGQPVLRAELTPAEAIDVLPRFHLAPFGAGANTNPDRLCIVRNAWHDDERELPVAIASPNYALLQHADLLAQVRDALGATRVKLDSEKARFDISPHGERVEARFRLAGLSFNPGDGHPLHLQLLLRNSVDGSCAVELSLRWMRQVCSNGMCVLTDMDRLREVHLRERLSHARIADFLDRRVGAAVQQQRRLREWSKAPVNADALQAWLDEDVRRLWGPHAAIRLRHICREGIDGTPQVLPGRRITALDKVPLRDTLPVPGAVAPARTLYAAYQGLTWLADHRANLEEREVRGLEAMDLLQKLATRERLELAA